MDIITFKDMEKTYKDMFKIKDRNSIQQILTEYLQ